MGLKTTWRDLFLPTRDRELKGSTGLGPDVPQDASGRESGKFRRVREPRLVAVAVVDSEGNEIGWALAPQLDDLIGEIRKLRYAMQLRGTAEDLDDLGDIDV